MKCNKMQPLLSEYVDNSLSARETWEVDRHVTQCYECARVLNELRRTVELVGSADRYEVSPEFVDRLETRISGIEPNAPRGAWLGGLGRIFRHRALPAWGLAVASCALAILVFIPHPEPGGSQPPVVRPASESGHVAVAANQNVALAASDPFADIATANLTAHASADMSVESDTR